MVSEAGIASGVRRIEAVVGPAAVEYLNEVDGIVQKLASQFKVKPEELPSRVAGTQTTGFHAPQSIRSTPGLPSSGDTSASALRLQRH